MVPDQPWSILDIGVRYDGVALLIQTRHNLEGCNDGSRDSIKRGNRYRPSGAMATA
jgi:hypothetical protein